MSASNGTVKPGASGGRGQPARRTFTGGLVVISGPSGSGKTTIVDRLEKDPRVDVAVTATTRPIRKGEKDGVDYHFLTCEEFQRRIDHGDFLEWNEVFRNGHLYGSLKAPLEAALGKRDRCYVMEIDVEGGLTLKRAGYDGRYIFIAPPSLAELERRIRARATEDDGAIKARIEKARFDLNHKDHYDVVVVNEDLEQACRDVRAAIGLD